MRLVRDIERRLEHLVEGVAGRVFRGQLHPVELGARLAREADLSTTNGPAGPIAPNVYTLRLNPRDLREATVPAGLVLELAAIVESTAADRGWRIEGPVTVHLERSEAVSPGTVDCLTDHTDGPLPNWGVLVGATDLRIPIRYNRNVVGRAEESDITLSHPEVSRMHALLWREGGETWVVDLGSANGTLVDGVHAERPTPLDVNTTVSFGPLVFTYYAA